MNIQFFEGKVNVVEIPILNSFTFKEDFNPVEDLTMYNIGIGTTDPRFKINNVLYCCGSIVVSKSGTQWLKE